MAESLESRKFDRKSHFDVPLPVRRAQAGHQDLYDDMDGSKPALPEVTNKMAFSLMTKRGNRPQVCHTPKRIPAMMLSGIERMTNLESRLARSSFLPTPASQSP